MTWVIFVLAMCLAGLVQGILGFGYAIVALGFLAYALDIRLANLVVTFSALFPIGWMLWKYRENIRWRPVRDCLVGGMIGLPIGLYAFVELDANWLTGATGLVILVICIQELLPGAKAGGHRRWSSIGGTTVGFLGGVLHGAVGVPGPPVVIYTAKRGWEPREFKALILAYFLFLSLIKCVGVLAFADEVTGASGMWDLRDLLVWCLAGLPCIWIGNLIGMRLFERIDHASFRRLTFLMLALAGLGMILGSGVLY